MIKAREDSADLPANWTKNCEVLQDDLLCQWELKPKTNTTSTPVIWEYNLPPSNREKYSVSLRLPGIYLPMHVCIYGIIFKANACNKSIAQFVYTHQLLSLLFEEEGTPSMQWLRQSQLWKKMKDDIYCSGKLKWKIYVMSGISYLLPGKRRQLPSSIPYGKSFTVGRLLLLLCWVWSTSCQLT